MYRIDVTEAKLLGANSARLSLQSLSPSTLSMSIRVDGLLSVCPYTKGEHYQIVLRGRTVIVGTCTKAKPRIQGGSRGRGGYKVYDVVISDYFDLLERSTYLAGGGKAGLKPTNSGTYYTTGQFATVPIGRGITTKNYAVSSADEDPQAVIGQTFVQICNVASENVVAFKTVVEIDAEAELVPFVVSASSYLSLLQDLQVFRPNSVIYWDYSEYDQPTLYPFPVPVLHFVDQRQMEPYVIDLTKGLVSELSLEARPDLVPPAVAFVQSSKSNTGQGIKVVNCYPPQADITLPGCVILEYSGNGAEKVPAEPLPEETEEETEEREEEEQLEKSSYTLNLQKMRVKGKALPRDAANSVSFWRRHNPRLSVFTNLIYGNLSITAAPSTGGEGEGYDANAISHELVEGSISDDVPQLKWGEAIVKQFIAYPGTPPQDAADLFPLRRENGHWYGEFIVKVRTINSIGGTYIIGGDGSFYPGEELPPDEEEEAPEEPDTGEPYSSDSNRLLNAARTYWEAAQLTPYEGDITYLDALPDVLLGRTLNVKGGEDDWASMRALLQGQEIDLFANTTQFSVGPPTHRTFTDVMSRTKEAVRLAERTKTEEAASNDQNDPGETNFSWNKKKKKRPQAPGVGPSSQFISNTATDLVEYDFMVKTVRDESGTVSGGQVKHGKVLNIETGASRSTGEGWFKAGLGAVYCNIEVDKHGSITKAELSNTRGRYHAYKFVDWTMDEQAQEASLLPGYYSYHIADIGVDKIEQHWIGTVLFGWAPPLTVIQPVEP